MRVLFNRKLFFVFAGTLLFVSSISAQSDSYRWEGIRDGILYFRSNQPATIHVAWEQVFAEGGAIDIIYFQSPDGTPIRRKIIGLDNARGEETLRIDSSGDYRLEIPGPSFRKFAVTVPRTVKSVLEPPRVHMGLALNSPQTYYALVPDSTPFSVCAINRGGQVKLQVYSPHDSIYQMELPEKEGRLNYDGDESLEFPGGPGGFWKIRTQGGGRLSVWLEGIPNVISLDSSHYFLPQLKPGIVNIQVSKQVVGKAPLLGAYLIENILPEFGYPVIAKLNLDVAVLYAGFNRFKSAGNSVEPFLAPYRAYAQKCGINTFFSLCVSGDKKFDGGKPDPEAIAAYGEFIKAFALEINKQSIGREHFIGIYDEPNLRFSQSEQFDAFFTKAIAPLIASPARSGGIVKLSAPETSHFLEGPSRPGSKNHRGSEIARRLLKKHWNDIDAISWHKFSPLDLIRSEQYYHSVEKAWEIMNECRPPGQPLKPLCITQCNMVGGVTIAQNDIDSYFGALWLTSVLIQASRAGKLHMFAFTPGIDQGPVTKGLIAYKHGKARIRPIGYAMGFAGEHIQPRVLEATCVSVECDVLATTATDQINPSILFVTKADRKQTIKFSVEKDPSDKRTLTRAKISKLKETGAIARSEVAAKLIKNNYHFEFESNGQGVYEAHLE